MKNHAFLIIAYKQPRLLKRIVEVLNSPNHFFFIHIDGKTNNYNVFKQLLSNFPNVHFHDERIKVYHAGVSELDATLALLKDIKESGITFDYIHIISGQDYPLRSNQQFDAFFEKTDESFMYFNNKELEEHLKPFYESCTRYFHFNNTNSRVSKIYERLGLYHLTQLFYKRKKIHNLYGGWAWFSWNKQVTDYVLDIIDKDPNFRNQYNYTSCCIKVAFTSLLIDKVKELHIRTNDPLRYISWHAHRKIESSYRPYVLNELDYTYIINSRAFFCRKVDEIESAKLLDLIDKQRNNFYNIEEHSDFV